MTSGNYCDLARQIYPSREDTLSQKTKEQLVEVNLTYEKVCRK